MDDETFQALRLWCQWNLGDADWAPGIRGVIEDPKNAKAAIVAEMKED